MAEAAAILENKLTIGKVLLKFFNYPLPISRRQNYRLQIFKNTKLYHNENSKSVDLDEMAQKCMPIFSPNFVTYLNWSI